jgi:hypothetical protein
MREEQPHVMRSADPQLKPSLQCISSKWGKLCTETVAFYYTPLNHGARYVPTVDYFQGCLAVDQKPEVKTYLARWFDITPDLGWILFLKEKLYIPFLSEALGICLGSFIIL